MFSNCVHRRSDLNAIWSTMSGRGDDVLQARLWDVKRFNLYCALSGNTERCLGKVKSQNFNAPRVTDIKYVNMAYNSLGV